MKSIVRFIGFCLGLTLLFGGAGNSDCGGALLPSAGISLLGLVLMFISTKGAGEC